MIFHLCNFLRNWARLLFFFSFFINKVAEQQIKIGHKQTNVWEKLRELTGFTGM